MDDVERNCMDKEDEIMLPGFRFHPTDEELVGFYLRRKIQQKPIAIELIKQLEIYKYDPWDLPKMATTGEKEWYFYCPRDRKYRNSARPNRVTGAGFWKATGTDRPIYSTEGAKCIGLKKSLVFYKGRAAKGIKTDWMMHEYRLPSPNDSSSSTTKRQLDKNFIPANESWAICRIFKKMNTLAQRAFSNNWQSNTIPESTSFDYKYHPTYNCTNIGAQFGSENIQFGCSSSGLEHYNIAATHPSFEIPAFKPPNFMFSPMETSMDSKPSAIQDAEKASPISVDDFEQHEHQSSAGFTVTFPSENGNILDQWDSLKMINFPFNLTQSHTCDDWKLNHPWDSTVCPSDMSTGYSSNRM